MTTQTMEPQPVEMILKSLNFQTNIQLQLKALRVTFSL